MDILQKLFDQLGNVVSAFQSIALTLIAPLASVLEDTTWLKGLVEVGMFDGLLEAFPDVSLFGLMFGSYLAFTVVFTLIKWAVQLFD